MAGNLSKPANSPYIPLEEVDPSKFSFVVMVLQEKVTAQILAALTPQVTTYREWAQLPGLEGGRVEEPAGTGKTLGDDWVYSHHSSGGGGYHHFTFTAKRTPAEAGRPIPALSYTTSDVYPWPDVLLSLRFVQDYGDPIETIVNGRAVYLPKLKRRLNMIEGGSYPSFVRVRVYASHKPFPETLLNLDVPVTGSIWWDLHPNQEGSIPACLHPYLEFPETVKNGGLLFGAGTTTVAYQFGQKAEFPATNHQDWRDHIFGINHQWVNGVWMLETREVLVPRGRRKLKNVT